MVYVRLTRGWTDPQGRFHRSGDMVDVDAATLAGLEADGVVADPAPVGTARSDPGGWVGPLPAEQIPTGGDAWAEPLPARDDRLRPGPCRPGRSDPGDHRVWTQPGGWAEPSSDPTEP